MNRPPLEMADIVRSAGQSFLQRSQRWISWQHQKVLLAIFEHARRHNLKRGGSVEHVSLEETAVVDTNRTTDLVGLDDAMNALARLDPRKAQVVEMRFFGGLSVEETAEVLKVSPVTVMRDWSTAKAWLYRELSGGQDDGLRTMETSR